MKVFDSELTERGTKRKKVYIKHSENSLSAKKQALIDISEYHRKKSLLQEKPLIPYKRLQYKNDDNSLKAERKKINDAIVLGCFVEPISEHFNYEITTPKPVMKDGRWRGVRTGILYVTPMEAKLYGINTRLNNY